MATNPPGDGWGQDWTPSPGWGTPPAADPSRAHPSGPAGTDPGAVGADTSRGDGRAPRPAPGVTGVLESGIETLRRRLGPIVVAAAPLALGVLVAEVLWWALVTALLHHRAGTVEALLAGTATVADHRELLTTAMWVGLAWLVLAVAVGGVRAVVDGWIAAITCQDVGLREAVRTVRPFTGPLVARGLALSALLAVSGVPALLLLVWFPVGAVLVALLAVPGQLVLLGWLFVRSSLMPVGTALGRTSARLPWRSRPGPPFWSTLGLLLLAAALAGALGAAASVPVQWLTAMVTPTVQDPAQLLDPDWWLGPHIPLAALTHLVATWVGYPAFSVICALVGWGDTRAELDTEPVEPEPGPA